MDVHLEAIKFNHDPASATLDAINIRKNATEEVPVPEWRRGSNSIPEDSVAAYSIRDRMGHKLTIQAQFSREASSNIPETIWIRAMDPEFYPNGDIGLAPGVSTTQESQRRGCAWVFSWFFWLIIRGLIGSGILGDVVAKQVRFRADNLTEFETFELDFDMIGRGIDVGTTTWLWQYRVSSSDRWTTFDVSRHKIYALLATPGSPWQQSGFPTNRQLPWTEVLDYATNWARRARTVDDVATRITQSINRIGPSILRYDCESTIGIPNYSTRYTIDPFQCTKFLERLRGGPGNGPHVNCDDCAAAVTTFSNVLGCELSTAVIGNFGSTGGPQGEFYLNPIRVIGYDGWQIPGDPRPSTHGDCLALILYFEYHNVAWTGACTESDQVFDACLEVEETPGSLRPLVPTNMTFGVEGDGNYRDKVARIGQRGSFQPNPDRATREWTIV